MDEHYLVQVSLGHNQNHARCTSPIFPSQPTLRTRRPNNSGYGVGRSEFDDASPQFPAASDILRGDSLYPSHGNGTAGSGAGGVPGGLLSAAEASSGVDELP